MRIAGEKFTARDGICYLAVQSPMPATDLGWSRQSGPGLQYRAAPWCGSVSADLPGRSRGLGTGVIERFRNRSSKDRAGPPCADLGRSGTISASASFGNGRDGESDPTRVASEDGRRDAARCVDPHLPPGSRSRPRLVSHWSASSGNRISQVGDAQPVREPLGKLLDQSRVRLRDISGFPFDRRVVVQF